MDKIVTHEPDQIFLWGMKIPAIGQDHARRRSSNEAPESRRPARHAFKGGTEGLHSGAEN